MSKNKDVGYTVTQGEIGACCEIEIPLRVTYQAMQNVELTEFFLLHLAGKVSALISAQIIEDNRPKEGWENLTKIEVAPTGLTFYFIGTGADVEALTAIADQALEAFNKDLPTIDEVLTT